MAESLHDRDIFVIGSQVPSKCLAKIALRYLNIPQHVIDTCQYNYPMDSETFNFKILEYWRNRHVDSNPKEELFYLLEEARKTEGLIDKSCYSFLRSSHDSDDTGKCALCSYGKRKSQAVTNTNTTFMR